MSSDEKTQQKREEQKKLNKKLEKLVARYRSTDKPITKSEKHEFGKLTQETVKITVKKYFNGMESKKRPSLEDMMQNGHLGLMDAVRKFDPVRDVEFLTYAIYQIEFALQHTQRDIGQGAIRVASDVYDYRKKFGVAVTHITASGQDVTPESVAKEMGIRPGLAQRLLEAPSLAEYLEESHKGDDGTSHWVDVISDKKANNATADVIQDYALKSTLDVIYPPDRATPESLRERQILELRLEGLRWSEIAKQLGVESSTVHYQCTIALKKLRIATERMHNQENNNAPVAYELPKKMSGRAHQPFSTADESKAFAIALEQVYPEGLETKDSKKREDYKILKLHFLEGLSAMQIVENLSINWHAVENRATRGLKRMRCALGTHPDVTNDHQGR